MRRLAIIPARGGSKRIPRKNIKVFIDKPIIAFSIETAIQSGLFDEVMVSTDDAEIAELSKKYGAKVPFLRSQETANDFATTMDVISEVVNSYSEIGKEFDFICCIYPTSPFIETYHLIEGLALINQSDEFEMSFPVSAFSYPIWRGLRRQENGQTGLIWEENLNVRSQDLETMYHDAGQWYWFKPSAIGKPIFGKHSISLVLDDMDVQDIDNQSDWAMAEFKYQFRTSLKNQKNNSETH